MNKQTFPIRYFFPSKSQWNFFELSFLPRSLQIGVRTDFAQEEPLDLCCLTRILAMCVAEKRIHIHGHADFGIWATPPNSLECRHILHRLLVHHSHLRRRRALFSEDCMCLLGTRLELCTFGTLVLTPHFLRWQMSITEAKRSSFFLSLCFQVTFFFVLHFGHLPWWWLFEFLPFFVHCCLCIWNFHRLVHGNELARRIGMTQRVETLLRSVIFVIFWWSPFQSLSRTFTGLDDACILWVWDVVGFAISSPMPVPAFRRLQLTGHSSFHRVLQLFLAFVMDLSSLSSGSMK